jgi:hypothetical protein
MHDVIHCTQEAIAVTGFRTVVSTSIDPSAVRINTGSLLLLDFGSTLVIAVTFAEIGGAV